MHRDAIKIARWHLPAAITLVCVGILAYYGLSRHALALYLDRQAVEDARLRDIGFVWNFERLAELVGSHAANIDDLRLTAGHLHGQIGTPAGYLSLNLTGRSIDARRFSRLRVRIRVDRASELALYFRPWPQGPIAAASPVPLVAGWNELETDVAAWHWFQADDGTSTAWGGRTRTIADLRLHPATAGVQFTLDYFALLPNAPATTQRPQIITTIGNVGALPPTETVLRIAGWFLPEQVLALRDRLGLVDPSISVITDQPIPPLLSRNVALWISLLLLASVVLASAWDGGVRRPGHAYLWLAAIGIGVAWLLTDADATLTRHPSILPATLLSLAICGLIWRLGTWRRLRWGVMRAWLACAIVALCLLLPVLAWSDSTPDGTQVAAMLARLLRYLPWAFLQQSLLCLLILPLCARIAPQRIAYVLTAVLFGLAHYPNFALMMATLCLVLMTLWLFNRYRTILPLASLHAVLGTVYLQLTSSELLRSGAIGIAYFH